MTGLLRDVYERFDRDELLLRASAISFQVLTAVVPFVLFLTAMAGTFGLSEQWDRDLSPKLQKDVSIAAYTVIDETVDRVLRSGHVFWATAGLALAVWQLSGAVRAAGSVLDRVHEGEDERPVRVIILRSVLLALAIIVLVCGAIAATRLAPLVYGDVGPVLGALLWLARYGAAAGLLLVAVVLVVRYATGTPQPVGWASVGSALVVVGWIGFTALFTLYLTRLADYGSIYGVFASVVVLTAWTYGSSLAFVAGVATDAALRDRADAGGREG